MLAAYRAGGVLARLSLIVAVASCGDTKSFDDQTYSETSGAPPASVDAGSGQAGSGVHEPPPPTTHDGKMPPCIPTQSSEPLRPRSSVMASHGGAPSGPPSIFTKDLFGLFASNCGGCHVDQPLGGFHVSLSTFPSDITSKVLKRLTSDDADFVMPPGSGAFSAREPGDPLVELASLLQAWITAGKPADAFPAPSSGGSSDSAHSYLMSETVGAQLSNLGSCVPPPQMFAIEHEQSDELDAMFEQATELPPRLEQTDLVTFDSEELAKHGVIAFAPAYTLWADNAKKIRYVRVPRGESIAFDEKTQAFTIPPNTRFYKTFLKRVVDLQGNESYRKIESRLIVSRPDETLKDGTIKHNALFGTYAWNEDETEAVLVRDPYRNGKPFRDRLFTYVLDEAGAEAEITKGPANLQEALAAAGLTRTYAIPGSERCIQCHMGSPTHSFVLGFSPLQLNRRPMGEGGVIEPAERDELDQLQRLIDYGVISGMSSPKDALPLEDAEGDRKPRNDHELQAQGYMLGNCAHCHNPRGFPSTIAPELRDVLDFMPSDDGGIFQFPLEKFSPRIFRGVEQRVPQPYITPSLVDRSPDAPLYGDALEISDGTNYVSKIYRTAEEVKSIEAPWRALIYRNVDTPFTYDEDFSIYPHMPMNTSGYDCRARQLLGSWMISIPAELKPFTIGGAIGGWIDEAKHPDPQPFTEIFPDDPRFIRAVRVAETRVGRFQKSPRYNDCPDPSLDIIDPEVQQGLHVSPYPATVVIKDAEGNDVSEYELRTPARPHYAVTDLTEPPGDWNPRRADWEDVLVDKDFESLPELTKRRMPTVLASRISDADELRAYALTDVPMAKWQVKPECHFDSQQKAKDIPADQRPRWMGATEIADDEPIYSISPGAHIFTFICQNCHGPNADSKGRLAATIADITGGATRVANLRDGIFGKMGMNRERIFEVALPSDPTTTVDDWAARYLAFMGLGGTQRKIPPIALDTIRNVTVLGETRGAGLSVNGDANMLAIAVALCKWSFPPRTTPFLTNSFTLDYDATPLVWRNGDAELWETLCAIGNTPLPVRIVNMFGADQSTELVVTAQVYNPTVGGLRDVAKAGAVAYPADALVGDASGGTAIGIQPDNHAPFCIRRPNPSDPDIRDQQLAKVQALWEEHAGADSEPPYCPDAFLADTANVVTEEAMDAWALKGAVNVGFSVFLYLDALSKGDKQPVIPIGHCEDLQ